MRAWTRRWLWLVALVGSLALVACESEPPAAVDPVDPTDPTDPVDPVDPIDPVIDPGPAAGDFQAKYKQFLDEVAKQTLEDFVAEYTPEDAAGAVSLSFVPSQSEHFELVKESLELTDDEVKRIDKVGFMASDRLVYPTFGEALLDVYAKDLPVLVTTDMLLHALHSSYDEILKTLEKGLLIATIGNVLEKAHAGLPSIPLGGTQLASDAGRDVDVFLAVARSLLADEPVGTNGGGELDQQVADFLGYIDAEQLRNVEIFGTGRKMDFSQFKPRGHYAGDKDLERYFRAMMWLGRVDLRFLELDPFSGDWIFHQRQLVAAHLLQRAVADAQMMPGWDTANDIITLMVGDVDYIDFRGLERMTEDLALTSIDAVASLDDPTIELLTASLLGGRYGEQTINSHWLETNPFSSEPTPLPPSFAFLGQRFVVDSYVFANVVYDNIVFEGAKMPRVLPDPLDALFVLGNNQVLPHLAEELDRYKYHANLASLRYLVDYYEPEFWEANVYNLWLQALRTLNPPTTSELYPEAMRTTAWRDKTINTQLGSWAQLRHDTLLYAKQSYTGGVSCEHPDGFVEPYPEFYATLGALADRFGELLADVEFPDQSWYKETLTAFFANWSEKTATLEAMAKKQLVGEEFSDEEVAFLKTTIMADMGCGAPIWSGWYPTLYINYETIGEWKPTIADVHTNPNSGPLPGPNVLHVATGNVNLMVLTAETCMGPRAYVGPVFSYYEVDVPEIKRLSDQDWEQMLIEQSIPERPEWTESFLVE